MALKDFVEQLGMRKARRLVIELTDDVLSGDWVLEEDDGCHNDNDPLQAVSN